MPNTILQSALQEWDYSCNETLKAVQAVPEAKWGFSPHPEFGSFAKQVRHVIGCRGVFSEAFLSGTIVFSKKHGFYKGTLSRDELIAALNESATRVRSLLSSLEGRDLNAHAVDYYGAPLGFVEHFSAMVCHEATHRGEWALYAAIGGFQEKRNS